MPPSRTGLTTRRCNLPLFFTLSFIIAVSIFSGAIQSAEVSCVLSYDPPKPTPSTSPKTPKGASPTQERCLNGYINGPISDGTYEKVVSFYRPHHGNLYRFYINSSSGNAEEAMKIGRFFRKYMIGIKTPAGFGALEGRRISANYMLLEAKTNLHGASEYLCRGDKCSCSGVCALIWFGAVDREGAVGLHRPPHYDPIAARADPDVVSANYRSLMKNVEQYLEDMETPKSAIESIIQRSLADTYWLQPQFIDRPPSIVEWSARICGRETQEERDLSFKLFSKRAAEKLGQSKLADDTRLLIEVFEKMQNIRVNCEHQLRNDHVVSLPAP